MDEGLADTEAEEPIEQIDRDVFVHALVGEIDDAQTLIDNHREQISELNGYAYQIYNALSKEERTVQMGRLVKYFRQGDHYYFIDEERKPLGFHGMNAE